MRPLRIYILQKSARLVNVFANAQKIISARMRILKKEEKIMCTALSMIRRGHYFGRNLDLEGSFGEGALVTPAGYKLPFVREGEYGGYAMIGTGILQEGFPLYFDACNSKGLGMAGLNFPKNAVYRGEKAGMLNVAPFELIPYVLGRCATAAEAKALLSKVNAVDIPFSEKFPLTPLHWIIADREMCFVAEPTAEGLMLYDDPVNVLTNNPPFPMQLENLLRYDSLKPDEPAQSGDALNYGRGMGAVGLPGDWSPKSRFARAAFVLRYTECAEDGEVTAFFRALNSVAMPHGAVKLKEGVFEETVYSCCTDTDRGIYYYTTRSNPAIHAVKLAPAAGDSNPRFYPFATSADIIFDN